MSPEQRERLVEVMARAIAPEAWREPTASDLGLRPRSHSAAEWREFLIRNQKPHRDVALTKARAVIAAAERAGFRIEVSDDQR